MRTGFLDRRIGRPVQKAGGLTTGDPFLEEGFQRGKAIEVLIRHSKADAGHQLNDEVAPADHGCCGMERNCAGNQQQQTTHQQMPQLHTFDHFPFDVDQVRLAFAVKDDVLCNGIDIVAWQTFVYMIKCKIMAF